MLNNTKGTKVLKNVDKGQAFDPAVSHRLGAHYPTLQCFGCCQFQLPTKETREASAHPHGRRRATAESWLQPSPVQAAAATGGVNHGTDIALSLTVSGPVLSKQSTFKCRKFGPSSFS